MSVDAYAELVRTPVGAAAAERLGLPRPARLRRHEQGAPLLVGPALVQTTGTGPSVFRTREAGGALASALVRAGADVVLGLDEVPGSGSGGVRLGAVVVDATGARRVNDLSVLGLALGPAVRRLGPSARVVVVGLVPAAAADPEAAAVQQGLEGIVRTVGKELRAGATANLLRLEPGAGPADVAGPLAFLVSARSAFVDGQVVEVGAAPASSGSRGPQEDEGHGGRDDAAAAPDRPLTGSLAVVTGAARGIGRATALVLARQGAHVVVVDVPAASGDLAATANAVRGTALALDVTGAEAPARLAEHLARRRGASGAPLVVVHNAGITRDRLLVNLDAARWDSVLGVNLAAPVRLTQALLEAGLLDAGGRVIGVSSTSGLAGNRGQANYAASKAGVAGWVRALAPGVAARGVTVNAVAPGFVETEMTARIPPLLRQLGRRTSSLQQGGLPVDVAETVAWLAEPGSAGVSGQVVRVCGQALVGA